MALNLMSSALYWRPIPCSQFGTYEFCKYFPTATMCLANPYDADRQLVCAPEAAPDRAADGRRH
jgi:hypothetical protein